MINEVRNTVLSVLNKNNYGYISPSDFNLFAANAQMELFEEYFSSYNRAINMENARAAGSDYAEIEGPIAETLESFLVTNFLLNSSGNNFLAPSLITTGDEAHYILRVSCHPNIITQSTNTSVTANILVDSAAVFLSLGIKVGDIVVNNSTNKTSLVTGVLSDAIVLIDSDIFLSASQDYSIISQQIKEAEKVSVGKIAMLNNSLLTRPSDIFPVYTLEAISIKVYPNTINTFGQVESVYFRHPKTPKWTYITLGSGEPIFDQSQADYQDFELPQEDSYRLVMKILQYCGISIRESEVAAFAIGQENQQNQ